MSTAKNEAGCGLTEQPPGATTLDDVVRELRSLRATIAGGTAELLSDKGAARLAGMSPSTWRRLVSAGDAPAPTRRGKGMVRWRRADILKWIANG